MNDNQQTSANFEAPRFQELDEGLYDVLTRQLQYQRNTISLLHLQLKQQNDGDVAKALEEKDKLIFALEKKVEQVREPSEAAQNSSTEIEKLKSEIEELENEQETDRKLLSVKNEELREVERKYNDHLNELHAENQKLKAEVARLRASTKSSDESHEHEELQAARSRLATLESDLKQAKQQIHYQTQRKSEGGDEQEKLKQELSRMQQRNEELRRLLEDKETQLMTVHSEERVFVENETLRNQVLTLKEEITRLKAEADHCPIDSSEQASLSFEDMDMLVRLYEECCLEAPADSELSQLVLNLCRRHDLEAFDCLGEVFDSSRHHVVETLYSTEVEHDTVFKEVRKGFIRNNQVFRKADVALSQNPMMCKSCSTQNKPESRFCFQCGSRLEVRDLQSDTPRRVVDDSENAKAYLDLGYSYLNRRELKLAMDAFRKAAVLHPESIAAYKGMALVQEACGDYPHCREILRDLEKLSGGDAVSEEIERRIQCKVQVMEALQRIL